MPKGGHVYILGSPTGTLYIGVTSDLYTRILQRLSGFAHQHHCTRLLYAEPFQRIEEAITREKQLKGWRREKKLTLIQTTNPTYTDLAEQWGWQRLHPSQRMDKH